MHSGRLNNGCMGHDHSHHHHHHRTMSNLKFAFWLNLLLATVELVGGFFSGSLSVISNSVHDFGDALALGLGVYLEKISWKNSNPEYSYGFRRFSLLASVMANFILLIGSFFIIREAVLNLLSDVPQSPKSVWMLGFAVLGIVANAIGAYRLMGSQTHHEKAFYWHLVEDLLGWVLVLFGAVAIWLWNLTWIDPVLGIALSGFILYRVIMNLRSTGEVFLQKTPEQHEGIEKSILKVKGVENVHHVHLWSLDGQQHILTAHIVVAATIKWAEQESIKREIKYILKEKGIFEATLEMESLDANCEDPTHA